MLASDLHVHLDGSLREATVVELTRAAGLLPASVSDEEFIRQMRFRPGMSLESCLAGFSAITRLMQSFESLERVSDELVQDCAEDGLGHVEIRFCPALHTEEKLSPDDAVEAVLSGIARGREQEAGRGSTRGISVGLIVAVLEGMSAAEASRLVELSLRFAGSGVTGVDLAGNEALFDAPRYAAPFREAALGGLGVTVHAGEGHDPSHVSAAVTELGAVRIGHGVSACLDAGVVSLLAERGTTVEVCLSSNVHTGAVSSLEDHPFRHLDESGVRVCLATDNRFFSNTTLRREYRIAESLAGASPGLLVRSALNSARSAFLPDEECAILERAYGKTT